MAAAVTPINPVPHITPQMIANARKSLGACNQCAAKIAAFKAAGYEFPTEEEINNGIKQKAEGLLAAADMLYNGQYPNSGQ